MFDEEKLIHPEIIDAVKKEMPNFALLSDLSELFKIMGDTTRLKILSALYSKEMCVSDLSALLEMNQSAISHQLSKLKDKRLVKYRKEGKVSYYSLDDEHIYLLVNEGLNHIKHK